MDASLEPKVETDDSDSWFEGRFRIAGHLTMTSLREAKKYSLNEQCDTLADLLDNIYK